MIKYKLKFWIDLKSFRECGIENYEESPDNSWENWKTRLSGREYDDASQIVFYLDERDLDEY